mgnify:CR=1 FL=1
MSKAKVLFVSPNPKSMSLLPPVVSIFYGIFRANDIHMKYFDTTFYDLNDHFTNPEEFLQNNLSVEPYEHDLPCEVTTKKGLDQLLKDFRQEVENYQPDVIMISALESTATLARVMFSSIRDLELPHVLGGVFATFAKSMALNFPEVDIICVGEGEPAIVPLVARLKAGQALDGLPGIWFKKSNGQIVQNPMVAPVDLDQTPRFSFEPFEDSRCYRAMSGKVYRMFPLETHRGCPCLCTFCNSPLQNDLYKEETGSKFFRIKSIEKIMEDVRYFVEECNAEYFFFWADNFLAQTRKDIDVFCEAYSEFKIPFFAQSYPATLDDDKIKKLSEVGLHRIGMGVEHGNEDFRSSVIKRIYSNERAIENVKILKKYGVQAGCHNIVGFPTETPELHQDTVTLNRALEPNSASCSIFTPFIGTELRKLALEKGYLDDPEILAPSNSETSILDMPEFSKEQIAGKSRTFNFYLKFPENRWKDIERAEEQSHEGDRIFFDLREECLDKYLM